MIQAVAPMLPNVVVMNSAALAKLGISASTPALAPASNVWTAKDGDDVPTRILRGSVTTCYNPLFNSLRKQMPDPIQRDLVVDALLKAVQGYNVMGITTAAPQHRRHQPDEHDEALALSEEDLRNRRLDRFNGVIQHAEIPHLGQWERLAELGLDLTVRSSFAFGRRDMIAVRFGPGLHQSLPADTGHRHHQIISSGHTTAGTRTGRLARQSVHDGDRRLRETAPFKRHWCPHPGHRADFATVDRNPITCDIDALPTTHVLRTHSGAPMVHAEGTLPAHSYPGRPALEPRRLVPRQGPCGGPINATGRRPARQPTQKVRAVRPSRRNRHKMEQAMPSSTSRGTDPSCSGKADHDTEGSLVLIGGTVLTCDDNDTETEAIAIADGRVLVVGDTDTVRSAAGPEARVVDLNGATVLPGPIDTHPHVLHLGVMAYPLVDLADVVDHDDIVPRIAAKAAETPAGKWVMTMPVGEPSYFIRRSWRDLRECELPTREALDRATS